MKRLSFEAKVYKLGINPCVDVPSDISSSFSFRKNGYIPVKITINGYEQLANLVPVKNHPYRLYINSEMRIGAGVKTGDQIKIYIEEDRKPRAVKMNPVLEEALSKNKKARSSWDSLAPSRQKEILSYLNFLKTPEALEKNVTKLLNSLTK